MPSFSTVLTWETMLSSTQRMETGTLAPHLSQRAVIPHFTAMIPVLLELRDISPGFASMIRVGSDSLPSSNPASELNRRMRKKLERGGDCEDEGVKDRIDRNWVMRETRPLDTAAMCFESYRIEASMAEEETRRRRRLLRRVLDGGESTFATLDEPAKRERESSMIILIISLFFLTYYFF